MFNDILNALVGLPQTQRDVHVLATAAQQAQSPELKSELERMRVQLETYATVDVGLKVVSAAALIAILVVLVRKKG